MIILGVSAYYHDSAAAILRNGKIVAAAQEERFTRKKHDPDFPKNAIKYCLSEVACTVKEIDYVVFYDKPLLKFERLLETYLANVPKGFRSFVASMPVWLKDKLFLKTTIRKALASIDGIRPKDVPPLLFTEHHLAHAASAFYPSPFEEAAVLCLDGVGEWATSSVWHGAGNQLSPQWEINFPHSLGLLYSAFTYFAGFKVNSGEYKLMGLAPYGEPKYVKLIYDNLVDLKEDGTFRLNMSFFNFTTGLSMTNSKFAQLFGGPPRIRESQITQREMDIARSVQEVTEEIVLRLASTIHREMKVDYLCLAGGVALNCVANGRLLREGPYKDIWVQPAAGDAGGALGAALTAWHEYLDNSRSVNNVNDSMQGAYLGGDFSNEDIKEYLDKIGGIYSELEDDKLLPELAKFLDNENIVGWFNGRMEFGPRALGARSILGDPRSTTMQSTMNLKIKYRESFRPFAPSIKAESVSDWFESDHVSPYMSFVEQVKEDKLISQDTYLQTLSWSENIRVPRSQIPAVTHVDNSARVQTVHKETNPRFYELIHQFEQRSGCPIIINTSFNIRGEPIVYTPEDAYRCFMNSQMDFLAMENILLAKVDQPDLKESHISNHAFEID